MLAEDIFKMEIDKIQTGKQEEKPISDKWRQLFEEDLLAGGHLKDYWRIWVPRAFVPPVKNEKAFEWEVKEEIVKDVLIGSLEKFISDGDPKDLFKSLSAHGASRSVCGKVFKMGEPSYNCRDCSTDVTCVLCVSCFKESTHRYHNYKMGTSMGGGCCDCGDTEAWKSDPYCNSHLAGTKSDNREDKDFSQEMIKRIHLVLTAVLQYCTEILTLDNYPGLPRNLRLREDEHSDMDMELYCSLVYHHESYTFQEVVSAIATVKYCSNKQSLGYVTCIDREGRTILKCSDFHHCNELKQNIEKLTSRNINRPLVATVVHSHVVAHQMFALRLLNWLLSLTDLSKTIRQIFTYTALSLNLDDKSCSDHSNEDQHHSHPSLVEGILLQDSFLWKSARLHWHRLFISGMFMEYENKKAFAKIFTRNYCAILKNFIRDDHDYSFSFASLSIQMFTVPTLAVYLIAQEDVLFKLLNTFVAECSKKRNETGKLVFSRATSLGSFRRAMYILHDLRYLLHSPPEIWDAELRRGFIKGVTMMLNLLTYMQGMNSVKRQVGQHMEFEPEWETAFSLQTKLSPVITLVLKWCSTDQIVFMKVFRLALKKLAENCSDGQDCVEITRELAGHKAVCYKYDVSTQSVSIHLPLSRFVAGLYLHLPKFGFSYHCDEFISLKKPIARQLIEPVIRTQVMIAQVQAGLWRKNGYYLSNQIYYYHSVKCRKEMQDKDVVLLQIGASLIESNEFLIHLLNKFNLLDWADPEFETSFFNSNPTAFVKTSPKVVEEFLYLLVTIVSERYVPDVGKVTVEDCLKNEIIHQLFIEPLSHSELNRRLPDDVNHHETGMECVIDEVATFKKPSHNSGKGIYIVKPELKDKYNVYFYHYSKEDMSKSEEEQRKERKSISCLECCPPPDLPSFTPAFKSTATLLQCDVMFHIMKIVLERTLDIKTRCYTEGQLHATLHLIGYALGEQEKSNIYSGFTSKDEIWDIKGLLEKLLSSHRVEAQKDLIKWTLEKYKSVSSPQNINQEITLETGLGTSNMEIDEQDDMIKQTRSKLAAEKRAAILAQMATLQQNFLKENASLFQPDSCTKGTKENIVSDQTSYLETEEFTVALGSNQSSSIFPNSKTFTCILCQEEQVVEVAGPALILSAFLQRSTVLSLERTETRNSDYVLGSNIGPAVHVSTCGHIMHAACWKNYINTIMKQSRRPYRILKQPLAFDIEKNEYLCPLCQRLSNTVLPVMPHLSDFCKLQDIEPELLPFTDWYEISLIIMEQNKKMHVWDILEEYKFDALLQNEKVLTSNKPIKIDNCLAFDDKGCANIPSATLHEIFNLEHQTKKKKEKKEVKSEDLWGESSRIIEVVKSFMDDCSNHDCDETAALSEDKYWRTWRACAYTIHASEWLLRYNNKSLFGDFTSREEECLENLIRLSGAISFITRERGSMRSICQWLLTMLFNNNKDTSVLEWDSLGILIPLTVCMPSTYYKDVSPIPLGKTVEKHCLRAALFINLAQTIICSDLSDSVFFLGDDVTSTDTECLAEIVRILKDCQAVNTIEIWEHLKKSSIQFLRCSAIFYHFLTGIPVPKALKEVGGDTYENLMSFLGMPSSSCKKLFGDPCVLSIFRKWAKHPNCVQLRHQVKLRNMMPMNELTRLPEDYSELINTATSFTCPKSDTDEVRNPTLCLVCGKMLCSETYCCQNELDTTLVGSCTAHAHSCGSGTGLFLRVRDCKVLLLSGMDRGCFVDAPYLDNYGEVDQGLKRGNPLRLCPKRYRELELLWLSHSLQEHIARSIEHNLTIINTQWHHL